MAGSSEEYNQAMHKCANPACSCSVPAEEEYCSDHCASMATMDSCDCGHPECEADTEPE